MKIDREKVFEVLKTVPRGKVMTYGGLAAAAGYHGCARAIGRVLHTNDKPIVVPCHRIVFSDGVRVRRKRSTQVAGRGRRDLYSVGKGGYEPPQYRIKEHKS